MGRRDFFVFLAIILVSVFMQQGASWAAGAAATPQAAADSIYGTVSGKYGSAPAFQQNIAEPVTSGNTQMSTLDGSVSFDAQLTCPSSSKFIEIYLTPLLTGDAQVTVSQDTNFDGVSDYTYVPPADISGVCANGVISCNAGTWQNCSYYQWTADSVSFVVSLQPVSMTSLGGCYCINQSCTANLSNYSSVLQDLGGGVAGAVQAVDSRFSISSASVSANFISYYGQDTSCATGSLTSSTLQTYYSNQDSTGLTNAVNAEVLTQSQDATSAYYVADQTFNNTSSGVYVTSCNITRAVTVTTNSYTVSGTSPASATMCVDHYLYARVYESINADGTADYYMDLLDTDPNNTAHYNCDAGGNGIGGWHTLDMVTLPRQASSVYFCVTASGTGCTQAPTNCVSMVNTQTLVLSCGNTNVQYPSYTYTYDLQYKVDVLGESINDGCSTLAADPNCQLRTETIDGVTTYANFTSTGNVTSQTCQTFTGVDTHNICRDYWTKTREYFCQGTNTSYDFSNVTARTDTVTGSIAQSGSIVAYTDYRADTSGAFYYSAETLTTPDTGPSSTCIDVCKVEVPTANTQAGLSGTTANYRTSTQSYDIFYKQCSNGQCPLDAAAGEQLLVDCACADDFAEAASIMSALQEASQDILCSSTGGW